MNDAVAHPGVAAGRRLAIAYRPLRELVPYARNARTHSAGQIKMIRASLGEFGWVAPMVIAGNDMIAGHARLRAALDMAAAGQPIPGNPDPWEGPTVDVSHLSPAQQRAYIIADNRLAEAAGWDRDLLRVDMSQLRLDGFDLSLTGFGDLEIDVLLGGGTERPKADTDRELTAEEKAIWNRAWFALMDDWHAQLEAARQHGGPVTTTYTKGALAVWFTRARFFGGEIPRGATLAYQPSRLWVSAHQQPVSEIFLAAKEHATLIDSIRWQVQGRPSFDKFLTGSLGIHGFRAPNDFPAHLARDLIDEFVTAPGGAVLDPCHGWGGRLLGFLLAAHASRYTGIDPSPPAQAGVRAMFDDLVPLAAWPKEATFHLQPYQEAQPAAGWYDFALTSPPYYDTEKYDGERQSWREFDGFDAWVAGFYTPLIARTFDALKPGATFALQVGSQMRPLARLAKEIGAAAGFVVDGVRQTDMTNGQMDTAAHDGEVVVLLRKPGGDRPGASADRPASAPAPRPPGYTTEVDGVTIRRVEGQDEVRQAIRVRQPWVGKSLHPLPAAAYHGAAERGRMIGAFDAAGAPIGYALFTPKKRTNVADVGQIAVAEHAPNGTGRALLTTCWQWAVDRAHLALTVTTQITNERAQTFYRKFGFHETERDGDDVRFRLDLSAPVAIADPPPAATAPRDG